MRLRHAALATVVATVLTALVSCGAGREPRVIRVPSEVGTVAEAVGMARDGDLVLIAPGVYHETVEVEHEGVTIRGEDRNTVILDGLDKWANGIQVTADGVAVENLTITGYQQNGLIFDGGYDRPIETNPGSGENALVGYRASYVTAYNNGLYGIYAFAARDGVIEHSLASGHPDSGIYVGQCKPCNVVVRASIAERNAIGYYGTNASGGVYIVDSVFRHNRLGMTPNSQEMEILAPQEEAVIAGNWVHDNDDPNTPRIMDGYFGGGIAVGGGLRNRIIRNLVEGNDGAGIHVTMLNDFAPADNEIAGNVLRDNGTDLVYDADPADGLGNCFTDNEFAASSPPDIELSLPCGAAAGALAAGTFRIPPAPPGLDYRLVPPPGPQPSMPGALTAPVVRPFAPEPPDLAAIIVPRGER